jgi:uncharacterized damage-inducible protein DinB
MNADAFRHFYAYHFALNRFMWNNYITALTPGQFTQPAGYSHGSVRDQVSHLMGTDEAWFRDLGALEASAPLDPARQDDRPYLRARWDAIENQMRAYLANLRDDMLPQRPIAEGEDKDLLLWQILLHVVNHGTDHRAQLLRLLNDLGLQTTSQDYIFYVYDNP